MNLWQRLFPKYNCRRCRDTGVIISIAAGRVCDCRLPALRIQMQEHRRHFQELVERNQREEFARKLGIDP